jgi:hypothetical protein
VKLHPMAAAAGTALALTSMATLAATPWRILPNPSTRGKADLTGVSCVSTRFCFAVGQSTTGALIETWDGHSWTLIATPKVGGTSFLTDVACVSADSCMAVGGVNGGNLVERWNGQSWRVGAAPPGPFVMRRLTCSPSGLCGAIGNSATSPALSVWSGGAWTEHQLPSKHLAEDVACVSRSLCVVVGATYGKPYAAIWNGASWSKSNPIALHDGRFLAISCWSTSGCFAVGDEPSERGSTAISEEWNGHRWKSESMPSPRHLTVIPSDIACTGPSQCVAVGEGISLSGAARPLAYTRSEGAWHVQGTPHLSSGGAFAGASLVHDYAVAVGERGTSNHAALIEQR